MIIYNSSFNYKIMEEVQSPTYLGLHLFSGTPPTRAEIMAVASPDSRGRISPYHIHINYTTLMYFYGAKSVIPTTWDQDNRSKVKTSYSKTVPNQFVYQNDGVATWFFWAWTAGSYPYHSTSTKVNMTIVGSVGDLDSNADLKIVNPTIAADTVLTLGDINIDHDIFEHMV